MILAWVSAAFVLGVIVGGPVPRPLGWAGLALALAALLFARSRGGQALVMFLTLAALAAGVTRAYRPVPPGPQDVAFYNGRTVTLQGVVATEPDIRDRTANYVVAVQSLTVGPRARSITGRVEVHTTRGVSLDFGDLVTLSGHLIQPSNSATLLYRDILQRQGIGSLLRHPRVIDLGPTKTGIAGVLTRLRIWLESGINTWLPEPEAALLIAITLGAKSASLGGLATILVATGLIHVIAISGVKVAMVAGVLTGIVRPLRNRLVALLVPSLGLWLYVVMTGLTPSGVRSAILWTLVFVATYLGRATVTFVSLAFAAAVMVAVDPSLPWDAGFQMSVIGTLAIVSLSNHIERPIARVPSPFRECLAVTLAALIGTYPLVAIGFHVTSWVGPLANALLLPLLPGLIVLGFLLGFAAGVPPLAAAAAALCYGLLHAFIEVASWLSAVPWATAHFVPSMPEAWAYYVVLAPAMWYVLRSAYWTPPGRWASRTREMAMTGVVAVSVLTVTSFTSNPGSINRLTPVGGGESWLLEVGHRTVLIAGPSPPSALLDDLGTLLPYNERTIDLAVVPDSRAATSTPLLAVTQHYRIAEALDVGAEYPNATYARWRQFLRQRHTAVYALRTGASFTVGPDSITALGPDGLRPDPRDCVGLLRILGPGASVLYAGQASAEEQREALFRGVSLHATTLIATAPTVDRLFEHGVGATIVERTAGVNQIDLASHPGVAP